MTVLYSPADDILDDLLIEILNLVDARKDQVTCGNIYATVAAALGQCIGVTVVNAGQPVSVVNETWKVYAQLSLDLATIAHETVRDKSRH